MKDNQPAPVDERKMTNSFITETMQICVVTRDYRRTLDGFVSAGIGPWAIYDFAPPLLTETTYRGRPASYSMTLCLAWTGQMLWEVIQPVTGPSIYTEFLDRHGEGIQHVAVACGDMTMAERTREFEARGFACIQSGVFNGNVPYAYFGTEEATGTVFEIFDIPDEGLPAPAAWYPEAPRD
ncbi:MAG: VOC family protein [Salinisphaeraceae bacterium]